MTVSSVLLVVGTRGEKKLSTSVIGVCVGAGVRRGFAQGPSKQPGDQAGEQNLTASVARIVRRLSAEFYLVW